MEGKASLLLHTNIVTSCFLRSANSHLSELVEVDLPIVVRIKLFESAGKVPGKRWACVVDAQT